MPRKLFIKSTTCPYHCYNRTIDKKLYPPKSMDLIWRLYQRELYRVTLCFNAKVHLFVMMGNHYHLIISTPDGNLPKIMQMFQANVAMAIRDTKLSDSFRFTPRYKYELIENSRYFAQCYKYVVKNPVVAQLCEEFQYYKYSSFSFQCGNSSSFNVPIYEFTNEDIWCETPGNLFDRIEWINFA